MWIRLMEREKREKLTGTLALALAVVLVLVGTATSPLAIVLIGVQELDGGTGCAAGVTGSPWKNVEDP